MDERIDYGAILRKAMELRGMRPAQLAKIVSKGNVDEFLVHQTTIGRLLRGKQKEVGASRWKLYMEALDYAPGLETMGVREPGGRYMIQKEGQWVEFCFLRDLEAYEEGTLLQFRDADGKLGHLRVVVVDGRKGVVPECPTGSE